MSMKCNLRRLMAMFVACVFTVSLWAQDWIPSELATGKFYLYNVAAKKYLCAGSSWGSHAALNDAGVLVSFTGTDRKFHIATHDLFFGGCLSTEGWMDARGAYEWVIEETSKNSKVYKLYEDGVHADPRLLYWNGGTSIHLSMGSYPGTDVAHWMLVSEEARIAAMANATMDNPVNATFLIKNADFARGEGQWVAKDAYLGDSPQWRGTSVTDAWGYHVDSEDSNYAVEQYEKTFDNYQELEVPNGMYHMTAKGFYRGTVVPYIYANDRTCALKQKGDIGGDNISNAAKAFLNDDYLLEGVDVLVQDGKLRVGVKSDEKIDWCVFDNFELTYYGKVEDPGAVVLAQKKVSFLEKWSEFKAYSEESLNGFWSAYNNEVFVPVYQEAEVMANGIEAVVDVAALEEVMGKMDDAVDKVEAAYVFGAEYDKWTALLEYAMGNTDKFVGEPERYQLYRDFLENKDAAGDDCKTIEAIEEVAYIAEVRYEQYVLEAIPVWGKMFDFTSFIYNTNFETNIACWQGVNAKHNDGEGYDGISGYMEIAVWSDESWTGSITQTMEFLPNGKYVLKMAWMAEVGVPVTLSANGKSVTVTGIGAEGGNIAKDGSVVEMGQGHRGWQYAEVETYVSDEDGTLTITVSSSADKRYMWSNVDAFELYYAGPERIEVEGGSVGSGTGTGVEAVTIEKDSVIYDLQGRLVEKAVKGVYIVNGKKVVVK